MAADVINIGQAKVALKRKGFCAHKHLTYDPQNQYVECLDCGLPVQPFEAFMVLVHHFQDGEANLRHRASELKELESRSERGLMVATRERESAVKYRERVENEMPRLRDHFAIAAISGLNFSWAAEERKAEHYAKKAYVIADAMLKAREADNGRH